MNEAIMTPHFQALANFPLLLATIVLVCSCKAEYCGENKIPFGLEIYHNAQPQLLCSRPTCFERRFADCDDRALRKSCESNDSWVGGFDKGYGDHQPLYVQCCTFEGLAEYSSPLYRTTIKPGEYFEGEEQIDEETEQVVSFDVITNFRMIRTPNSTYVISIL
ncbi:unnamed protein product [Gongylonema pulchrum]|uniref:WxxW domain-containing protein n=1 Tax=Gongylonema pulchrum TaxID=637853 RepID=A0A183EBG0_9BILA|nr:unnamed protein product [Gongylonema pulchrum]